MTGEELPKAADVQECPAAHGGGSAQPITARLTVVASCRFDDPDALSKRASVLLDDPHSPWGHGMGAWGLQQSGAVDCLLSPVWGYTIL